MVGPDLLRRREQRRSARALLRESFISGLAVVVPVLITVLVLTIAINSVYKYLDLFSSSLAGLPVVTVVPGVLNVSPETLFELAIPPLLLCSILLVGIVMNSSRYGERAVDYFDYAISEIPGVGSVYESFRQMSDVMLESDTQSFRDVKLVEFPHEGAYTLGFVTTETPDPLREPTGHERMVTLFLPLAPNPVMGGHLVHVPEETVMDVDMSVEEGIRAVVTSGVAVSGGDGATGDGLSPAELRELSSVERVDQRFDPRASSPTVRRDASVRTDRPDRYDEQVSPERATTAQDIVRREREEASPDDDSEETPAELESRDGTAEGDGRVPEDIELSASHEETEYTPAELEHRRPEGGDVEGDDERDTGETDGEGDDGETDGEGDDGETDGEGDD
ncbi:MAG: DUF502 domain-containing protein, partial [Haloferacaceae archaeon]